MAEWAQQSHFLSNHAAPGVLGGVTSLYFDPCAELLWTGSGSGQVTSHSNTPPTYARYTSFAAHGNMSRRSSVHSILGNEKAIFSVGDAGVHAANRSGLARWTVSVE